MFRFLFTIALLADLMKVAKTIEGMKNRGNRRLTNDERDVRAVGCGCLFVIGIIVFFALLTKAFEN